jgi:hypothetical protein
VGHLAVVERIYAHFEIPLLDETRRSMQNYLAANPRDEHGVHRYSHEDFGFDRAELAPRFNGYCKRFGLIAKFSRRSVTGAPESAAR